ncbi:hypothetical protein [Mesorhizobium sp. B2-4-15]|uniref:hypothetical protein n=1 Tax=Mesorhizobium sp. B2-4-15 TaxID=2589934 RepID=UPI0015EF4DE9|nr:hypothetical protein [Mesorhizobium sp. B2-4-15]
MARALDSTMQEVMVFGRQAVPLRAALLAWSIILGDISGAFLLVCMIDGSTRTTSANDGEAPSAMTRLEIFMALRVLSALRFVDRSGGEFNDVLTRAGT